MTFTDDILDSDGYPTEEFLTHIQDWPFTDGHDALMEFAMSGHIYPQYRNVSEPCGGKRRWTVSTGGWSGNEAIIEALENNTMFWMMCWQQSRRGGHYIFETPVKPASADRASDPAP